MSIYDAVAERALAQITKKGGVVTFPGANVGTPQTYDPATDTYSGGTPPSDATGRAVQIEGDPDRFKTLGLVLVNPVTLMIAAAGLGVTPAPGMLMSWGGKNYNIKDVDPVMPDGVTPIIYTVIGSA